MVQQRNAIIATTTTSSSSRTTTNTSRGKKVTTSVFMGTILRLTIVSLFIILFGSFYSMYLLLESERTQQQQQQPQNQRPMQKIPSLSEENPIISKIRARNRMILPNTTNSIKKKITTESYNSVLTNAQQRRQYRWNTTLIHHTNQYYKAAIDNHQHVKFTNEKIIDMRIINKELEFDNIDGGVWKQGYDLQPRTVSKDHPLYIYVVPHSHCDPGWIKSFDDYFYSQTSQIITTVVQALVEDSRRKFIWAEISYFSLWYDTVASTQQKEQVKTLLQNHQLEFVTGGWVQPDEANSELYAMEIQLQEGHSWINNTFGEEYIPRYGWSIDPFGYSSSAAYLWKQYHMKAMLIQRVHYRIKKLLAQENHFEFYWRQTWDTSSNHEYDIYTHVMPFFSYDVPHTCGPDPSICCQFDFRRMQSDMSCPWHKPPQVITDDNVKERSLLLLDQYLKKATLYNKHNAVLIPLGDDFRWQTKKEADDQYINYQKIFDYINTNVDGVTIQFGTLSNYFDTILQQQHQQEQDQDHHPANNPVPVLQGSFFTYSDVNQDYWSGYYTSRIFDKVLGRKLERILYVAETLPSYTPEQVQEPRRALSLFQHHDGVTGTAKDYVVNDYAKRMYDSIETVHNWILQQLTSNATTVSSVQRQLSTTDSAISSSSLDFTKLRPCYRSDSPRESFDTNRCGGTSSTVLAYNPLQVDQKCNTQIVPPREFQIVQLPCEIPGPITSINSKQQQQQRIEFDPITGLMIYPIHEEWKVWRVEQGGAYLFFPDTMVSYLQDIRRADDPIIIEQGGYVVKTKSWKRTVIQKEIPQSLVEDNTVPDAIVFDFIYETFLQIDNNEWLVRYSTADPIHNHGIFYTDLNGFNFDQHYYRKDLPIQSQVFPMPTVASVQDAKARLTVISEHAQGTASLQEGTIDVWLDRRLAQDDARGLGQGVQDNRPTQTRFRIVYEYDASSSATATPSDVFDVTEEFDVTSITQHMWDTLQHPLVFYGNYV